VALHIFFACFLFLNSRPAFAGITPTTSFPRQVRSNTNSKNNPWKATIEIGGSRMLAAFAGETIPGKAQVTGFHPVIYRFYLSLRLNAQ
jgi:hypothetical protein